MIAEGFCQKKATINVSFSMMLPMLDRFSNWLMSGEVKIFREFYNTEFGNDLKSLSIG
jgi:predicted nuclease of restriction endonuclease-like RecB superfamily